MSDELKLCPFCGSAMETEGYAGDLCAIAKERDALSEFKDSVPWMYIRDAAYGNAKAAERVQTWWKANNPNLAANAPKPEKAK